MPDILSKYVDRLGPKAEGSIKGTAKLVIKGHGSVMLDENGASVGDSDADVTLQADDEVFQAIFAREQNPVSAVLTGKLEVDGSQMRALKISEFLLD